MNKNWLIAGFALIFGLAVSIYTNTQKNDVGPAAASTVYDLTLQDLEGQHQDFSQWRGSLLLVNFWASWCPPCRNEIPLFISMQEKYRENNFHVIGISIENPEDAKRFRDKLSINYPLLDGNKTGMSLMTSLGNTTGGLPFSVLFDRSGKKISSKTGEFTSQELDDLVKSNL